MGQEDINKLLRKVPEDMDIELNVSCPNTEKSVVENGCRNSSMIKDRGV